MGESSPNKKPSKSERSSRNQSPEDKKGRSKKKQYEDYYYEDEKSYSTKEYYGKKKGSGSEDYYYEDTRGSKAGRGGSSKSYRANREANRADRKKKEGDTEQKVVGMEESADLRVETDASMDQDTSGKNEKVVEKQPAKQTETEQSGSDSLPPGFVHSFKPVEETSEPKMDVKPVKANTPLDDDITHITSAPTVITLDND